MAFRLFIESSQGRRRGRRPRPQRIDDYAAHFHHHPWRDAQLALTPRLLKRLGDGVGGTADDGDESSEADAERAIAANDYVASVSEAPRCVVLIDARGAVSEALKSDVGAARRVILRMRRICDDAKLGETASDAHWEADQLRCSFGRCGIALAFCAHVVAMVGPGCRAALHFSEDAVATEYPSGRPHGEAWNVLCELVECVASDESRCCVSDACRDRLKLEGLDDDDAWTRIEGGYLRAPWPSLSLSVHSCDVVHQEPVERVVVVAMVYFDASLKSTSRLYVERRRALDVLEAALTSKGGKRAMGSDTLYIFDACVSRALDTVLASRKALEGIKAGFGVARGPIFEGEVVAGSCVGVAARVCSQHGILLSQSAADALEPDLLARLRTVPVFLQGSDSSGVLEEFCQVLC